MGILDSLGPRLDRAAILTALQTLLNIDEEWTVRTTDSFSWWPHATQQRFFYDGPYHDAKRDMEVWRLTVETDFLRNVPADKRGVVALLNYAAPMHTARAGTDGRIWLSSSTLVYDAMSPYHVHTLFLAAALQAAAPLLPLFSKLCEHIGELDRSPHPTFGYREDFHRVVNVVADHIGPMGAKASEWKAEQFDTVVEFMNSTGKGYGTAGGLGLSFEIPFGNDTALVQARADEANPWLGHGLLLTALLPLTGTQESTDALCQRLTELDVERNYDSRLLGSWIARPVRGAHAPGYQRFVPNALYAPDCLATWVGDVVSHMEWLRSEVGMPESGKNAVELMLERLEDRAPKERPH